MTLSQENNALKNAVKRRNQDLDALKADYERLKCYVQSLPPHPPAKNVLDFDE